MDLIPFEEMKLSQGSFESLAWRRQASLFATDGMRSFAQGYFSITYVVIARNHGISALGLGVIAGISTAVGIGITHFLAQLAYRLGARTSLVLSGLLMAATGTAVALAHSTGAFYACALLGFLPPSGGMFVGALVEGVLAQAPPKRRTIVFARNGLVVTVMGAAGALFASFPTVVGMSQADGLSFLVWLYAGLGFALAGVSFSVIDFGARHGDPRFSGNAVVGSTGRKSSGSSGGRSDSAIRRLSFLFVLDSAGSGVVAKTLVIFWLRYHFNLSIEDLSGLYFGMDVLTAVSFPLAERISRRLGLLNTAVFTHIPSSLLLAVVPFAPNALVAAALLLARSLLVEMDVPTRKSYVASIVRPEERRLAASRTSMGRQAGRSFGPVIGGFLLSSVSAVAPFLASAVMKISYDLLLWRSFKSASSPEAQV